jgi:hypothetical protein
MAPDKPESWGFQGLAGLLRDLGPTEGETKVYRKFKELYQKATTMSAGEPPDEWRPPGQLSNWRPVTASLWDPDWELKDLAADSLETTLKLRQNKPIQKPSDREEECHRKLLTLAIKMGDMMKLKAEQVRIDTANENLQEKAHYVTKELEMWADAVSAPDCGGPGDKSPDKYNWEPAHLIQKYHTTMSSPKAVSCLSGEIFTRERPSPPAFDRWLGGGIGRPPCGEDPGVVPQYAGRTMVRGCGTATQGGDPQKNQWPTGQGDH